jgi:hypothetical protein
MRLLGYISKQGLARLVSRGGASAAASASPQQVLIHARNYHTTTSQICEELFISHLRSGLFSSPLGLWLREIASSHSCSFVPLA